MKATKTKGSPTLPDAAAPCGSMTTNETEGRGTNGDRSAPLATQRRDGMDIDTKARAASTGRYMTTSGELLRRDRQDAEGLRDRIGTHACIDSPLESVRDRRLCSCCMCVAHGAAMQVAELLLMAEEARR